jgi:hypothetical protein
MLQSQMAGVRRTLEEREREEHLRLKHLSRKTREEGRGKREEEDSGT